RTRVGVPDRKTPFTCRISVYDSSTDRKVAGSLYMEQVQVKVGIFFSHFPKSVFQLGACGFNSDMKCNFVICTSDYGSSLISSVCEYVEMFWEQVKEILGDSERAAIQTQGSTSNPFGSTFVYGYPNAAFEVMTNGYIATVTLFQS
ncbi:hypothetical protein MIMGU_mgv11b0158822mg, partial [Erythranthe guttata]